MIYGIGLSIILTACKFSNCNISVLFSQIINFPLFVTLLYALRLLHQNLMSFKYSQLENGLCLNDLSLSFTNCSLKGIYQ